MKEEMKKLIARLNRESKNDLVYLAAANYHRVAVAEAENEQLKKELDELRRSNGDS